MPQRGDINKEFGIFESLCCEYDIVLAENKKIPMHGARLVATEFHRHSVRLQTENVEGQSGKPEMTGKVSVDRFQVGTRTFSRISTRP
jgi:hypothetical protein